MKKNTKVLVGTVLIITAILTLLVAATPGSSGVEVSIVQLQADPAKYTQSEYLLTQGYIIEDSIDWNADKIELRFKVKDEAGNTLDVIHPGVKPDNFSEGIIAILEGSYRPDGIFEAEKVKTRCPSKYEGRDPKDLDPEIHKELQNNTSGGK